MPWIAGNKSSATSVRLFANWEIFRDSLRPLAVSQSRFGGSGFLRIRAQDVPNRELRAACHSQVSLLAATQLRGTRMCLGSFAEVCRAFLTCRVVYRRPVRRLIHTLPLGKPPPGHDCVRPPREGNIVRECERRGRVGACLVYQYPRQLWNSQNQRTFP